MLNLTCASINETLAQMGYRLDNVIKIPDFITLFAVLLTLLSITLSQRSNRNLRQREQADRFRNAAVETIAKLDRMRMLSLSMFNDMEKVFIDINNLWTNGTKKEELKKLLSKILIDAKQNISKRILDEGIETTYFDLYGFDPYVQDYFKRVFNIIKDEQEMMFRNVLLPKLSEIIDKKISRESDSLIPLTDTANFVKGKYQLKLDQILGQVSNEVSQTILAKKDGTLLSSKNGKIDIIRSFNDLINVIVKNLSRSKSDYKGNDNSEMLIKEHQKGLIKKSYPFQLLLKDNRILELQGMPSYYGIKPEEIEIVITQDNDSDLE